MLYFILPVLWLIGAISFYVADGYFHFNLISREYNYSTGRYYDADNTALSSLIWPVMMWVVIAQKLKITVVQVKKRQVEKQEKLRRIRVIEEEKTRQFQLEAERETEQYFQELTTKQARR